MTTPPSVQSVERSQRTIPDDLAFEILLRLPPKSVARFRCISKSWNNYISGPYFREKYGMRSKNRANVLFHKSIANLNMPNQMVSEKWGSFNTKTLTVGNTFTTLGIRVSNLKMVTPQGLICFLGSKNNDDLHVFLYSFTSQLLLELPKNSESGFFSLGRIVGFGIGYIPSTKKFKIVLWFIRNTQLHQQFPVYNCQVIEINNNTLTGDENGASFSRWRLIDGDVYARVTSFGNPVNVESTLHWKTRPFNSIISFNLETERLRRIVFYTNNNDFWSNADNLLHLVDLQGTLGILKIKDPSHQYACIWRLLRQHGNVDDDVIPVKMEIIYTFFLGGCFAFQPLWPLFFQGEEILLYSRDYVMFYNLETGSVKTVRIANNDETLIGTGSVVGMFYDTLAN